jgi:hypothetical protein
VASTYTLTPDSRSNAASHHIVHTPTRKKRKPPPSRWQQRKKQEKKPLCFDHTSSAPKNKNRKTERRTKKQKVMKTSTSTALPVLYSPRRRWRTRRQLNLEVALTRGGWLRCGRGGVEEHVLHHGSTTILKLVPHSLYAFLNIRLHV